MGFESRWDSESLGAPIAQPSKNRYNLNSTKGLINQLRPKGNAVASFPITLTRHIIEKQAAHPAATGEFSALMVQIGLVGKMIAQDLRRADLINILGGPRKPTLHGETLRKRDSSASQPVGK